MNQTRNTKNKYLLVCQSYLRQQGKTKEIVALVNEADSVFFDIYTQSEAKEVGIGNLSKEGLVSGEKTRNYLILKDKIT